MRLRLIQGALLDARRKSMADAWRKRAERFRELAKNASQDAQASCDNSRFSQMQAHKQQEAKFEALSHELQMCAKEVGSHYSFHEAEALLDLPIALHDYLKARYFLVEEMCQEADAGIAPDLAGEAIEIADAVLKEFFTEVAHTALLTLTSKDTSKVAYEIHKHALDAKKYACLWYKKAARESGTHNISNDSIPYAAAGGEGRYTAI